jgi:hypothetical protein
VTSAPAIDDDDIEIDAAPGFEDAWSKAKVVLVVLLSLFVLGGAAGLFGRGPLSKTSADFASGRLEWERFARRQTAGRITLEFKSPAPTAFAEVTIDRALADRLTITATHPMAAGQRATAEGESFLFALGPDRRGVVTFDVEPSRMGLARGSIRIQGQAVPVSLFVWP